MAYQRYYAHITPSSIIERLMISARDRIFSDFMSRMLPSPDHHIPFSGLIFARYSRK
jgi:hypothetical protein